MKMTRYPKLVFFPERIRENAARVTKLCREVGVSVVAVCKGVSADPEIAWAMTEGGCTSFADSRIQNLARLKEALPRVPRTLLRIPAQSELNDLVETANCSLASEAESVRALESCCRRRQATHGVVLMFDLGDRREGIFEEELDGFAALFKECPHVRLRGVGVNFGCFSGVLPSAAALNRLCRAREVLEAALGHGVSICSGGSTSSLMLIERGELPSGVTQLRVGEAILLGRDVTWRRDIPWLRQDTAFLEAEVIEVRARPSLPEGEVGADAFGRVPRFRDVGTRLRAIVAVGRQDVPCEHLIPEDPGIHVLGGSGDHTLLDIQDSVQSVKWGGVLRFSLGYAALLGLSTSSYVRKEYVREEKNASG